MKPHIVALVPMRHVSKRVPGKNYRLLGDRPLYHHIIRSLQACPLIEEIVIDTDSSFIKEDAGKHFPTVRLLDRPQHLRADTVPMNDVLLHDIKAVPADYYIQAHSTNPLLRNETITQAVQHFLDNVPMFDSLFSVTCLRTRLWDGLARPINHNPAILLRTQDLPPVFEENSCFYIFTREILESRHNRIGLRPLLFEVDAGEAWDIDEELDFQIAEFLYRKEQEG